MDPSKCIILLLKYFERGILCIKSVLFLKRPIFGKKRTLFFGHVWVPGFLRLSDIAVLKPILNERLIWQQIYILIEKEISNYIFKHSFGFELYHFLPHISSLLLLILKVFRPLSM